MSIVLESVPVGGSLSSWKRRGSDEEDEVDGPTLLKRSRYSYYFTLESESPEPTDEDEESVYSFQENETDYVRDTSDISSDTDAWETDSNIGPYEIEYEVASPCSQNVNEDSLSSSDPEDVIAVSIAAVFCETDDLADNSDDSRSTVDSEIGKADYWTCVQCNTSNNNPLFRYCERCYKERKNFFPPRPKRKRRRRKEKTASQSSEISISSSQETVKLEKLDSGIASQEEKLNLSLDLVDGHMGSGESEVNTPSSSSQELLEHFDTFDSISSTGRSQIPSDKLCIVCAVNPKNGVFVHGNIVHICCCYKCAVKVWKTNDQKCPLCKRQVTQVLKAFYT